MTEKVKGRAHWGAGSENKNNTRKQLKAAASRKQQVEAELDPGGCWNTSRGGGKKEEKRRSSRKIGGPALKAPNGKRRQKTTICLSLSKTSPSALSGPAGLIFFLFV